VTKRELVNDVADRLGVPQNEVSNVVQELLDAVTEVLVEGNRLEIRNFGVFEVKERESRIGRNPRTGEEVPIPKKRVTSFRPGKTLKERVEKGPDKKTPSSDADTPPSADEPSGSVEPASDDGNPGAETGPSDDSGRSAF